MPEFPWSAAVDDVVAGLQVEVTRGLSSREAVRRRRLGGPNVLRRIRTRSAWAILWDQLRSVITLLLLVGAALSFAFGETLDGSAIMAVILLNTAIGFTTEIRAFRSMESLRRLAAVTTRVRRDGVVREVPAQDLVPGDLVVFEAGDVVTADLRLIQASRVQATEAALTGESAPVPKQQEPVPQDAALGDRRSMLFSGTAVTRGAGEGLVVATGMRTELGNISSLVEAAEAQETPMAKRLDRLGQWLAWASLGLAALVGIAGILSGKETFLVVETVIALAVATVPEGLPIVATMALARGMWRMARRNALIEQLPAVETLGSTTVILTDKTGTLTEDKMTVTRLRLADRDVEVTGESIELSGQEPLRQALLIGALCNDAELHDSTGTGDPMELALLEAARKAGLRRPDLLADLPEVREEAFDPAVQMMATFHRSPQGYLVAVKGAPEAVMECCEIEEAWRKRWSDWQDRMAAEGLRVLALATKTTGHKEENPYEGLRLVGLVGLMDPPRTRVREAIDACRQAGIRVVMVTGDHPATAMSVGRAVGLVPREDHAPVAAGSILGSDLDRLAPEESLRAGIIARTSPEQKLRLIERYQDAGEVVAMLGDGVNDAPALKKADIGIAMGVRGTQVAREAAAMILRDDELATIPVAVEQGRVIFSNIRKFVIYLLSCNLSEILTVGAAAAVNAPLPILPLQILFLNLVTDVFPALALGVGEGTETTMQLSPRRRGEPVLDRRHWRRILGFSLLIAVPVLVAFVLARRVLGMEPAGAVTVSFLTLAFSQLTHLFNMADTASPIWRNEVTRNRWAWGALALCTGLLLSAVYLPGLAEVLQVQPPGAQGWLLVVTMSLVPWIGGSLWRAFRR